MGSVTTYWDLVTRLSDREFVKVVLHHGGLSQSHAAVPGWVIKDMAVKVVGENQLARGVVEVGTSWPN